MSQRMDGRPGRVSIAVDQQRLAAAGSPLLLGLLGRPTMRALLQLALVVIPLVAMLGCQTQPVIGSGPGLSSDEIKALVAAGDWPGIAAAQVDCNDASDLCAELHAIRADACLRLAIQLPADASATKGRTRQLLDDAESGYRLALQLQGSSESPRVSSYHGGLLLTLSERRNRLDDSVQENKLDRENQKLLSAAEQARTAVPDSALGYVYGASAVVYHALLKESGTDRCDGLTQAAAMLRRSPKPPAELIDEQQRLKTLIERSLRDSRCVSAHSAS